MQRHILAVSLILAVLSTACGAPPEEKEDSQQQLAPPPVTLGDMWSCFFNGPSAAWSHDIYRYSDGSVFTSCEVTDGIDQTINVEMFRGNQAGAASAACLVTYDWDTSPTSGSWRFTFNGTSSTAKYSDGSSSFNGMTQYLSCTKF